MGGAIFQALEAKEGFIFLLRPELLTIDEKLSTFCKAGK